MQFFRCYSTPRSGHHSILYWLMYQHSHVTEFQPLEFWKEKPDRPKRVRPPITLQVDNYHAVLLDMLSKRRKPDIEPHLNTDRLLLGYENGMTPSLIPYEFDVPYVNIIILRDIFNTAASVRRFRLWARRHNDRQYKYPPFIMDGWLNCAKAISNNEGYFINYNMYNHNVDYRQQVCKDLGLHFTDIGIDYVPRPGSSFAKMDKPDRPMLNKRYKMVDIGPIHQNYPQHVKLSNEIFGVMK